MVLNTLRRLCREYRAMFPSSGARRGLEKPCWRALRDGQESNCIWLGLGRAEGSRTPQTAHPHPLPCRGARAGRAAASLTALTFACPGK